MDPVVVDPVLAEHGAPLLGGHVPGYNEVSEGPVVVLEVPGLLDVNIGVTPVVETWTTLSDEDNRTQSSELCHTFLRSSSRERGGREV